MYFRKYIRSLVYIYYCSSISWQSLRLQTVPGNGAWSSALPVRRTVSQGRGVGAAVMYRKKGGFTPNPLFLDTQGVQHMRYPHVEYSHPCTCTAANTRPNNRAADKPTWPLKLVSTNERDRLLQAAKKDYSGKGQAVQFSFRDSAVATHDDTWCRCVQEHVWLVGAGTWTAGPLRVHGPCTPVL